MVGDSMLKQIQIYKLFSRYILPASIVSTILFLVLCWVLGYFLLGIESKNNATWHHAIFIVGLTFLLVIVAWVQLQKIKEAARADFLLRVDDRYGGELTVEARTIIHIFYRDADKLCEKKELITEDARIRHIQSKIKELGQSKNEDDCKKFVCLLNFLDFLETIAYFCNHEHLAKEDINELLGGTLTFHYKVFESWICYRRCKYKDEKYYIELEKLVKNENDF
jgi:hypothetical protein